MGENLAVELRRPLRVGGVHKSPALNPSKASIFPPRWTCRANSCWQSAMDKASTELGLTAFKTPESTWMLDDYTVWSELKNAKPQTR